MKKVLFFTQNRWAYGSIHHGLSKELYKYNIYANLLDWTQVYSMEEYSLLNKTYDVFVTTPDAIVNLYTANIPLEKIITVAHGQWDLLWAKQNNGTEFYDNLRGYAVISDVLKNKSAEFGIKRIPSITPLGIHFDTFYENISNKLSVIGYAGQKECFNFFKQEIKRGRLVENIVRHISGVKLVTHNDFNHLCMPGYYKTIDCLIMSSIEEAGGLPIMEASAAGRLVIGTPVGYFKHNCRNGAGIEVPLDENEFIKKVTEHIIYYRDNPQQYKEKCENIQQFARENYDWSCVIDKWINILQ